MCCRRDERPQGAETGTRISAGSSSQDLLSIRLGAATANPTEVATRSVQGEQLSIKFLARSKSQTPQHRQRRTPSLQPVLQQEPRDDRWRHQPAAMATADTPPSQPEQEQYEGRGVRLKRTLDIPSAIELANAIIERLFGTPGQQPACNSPMRRGRHRAGFAPSEPRRVPMLRPAAVR